MAHERMNHPGYPAQAIMRNSKVSSTFKDSGGIKKWEDVMSGSCHVWGLRVDGSANSTEAFYVKLFDAAAITLGTTVPEFIFEVPASGVHFIPMNLPHGEYFTNGLSVAVVTGAADAGATGVTDGVTVEVFAGEGKPANYWD